MPASASASSGSATGGRTWSATSTRSAAAEAAWMCDLRPELLDTLGRRFPAVRQTRDLDEMLDDRQPGCGRRRHPGLDPLRPGDAGARGGQARVRREAARVVVGCWRSDLIRTAYERGLVLMPGHTFLYSPPVIRIRDLIRSGELGEIYFISMSRVNLGLHQSDVSVHLGSRRRTTSRSSCTGSASGRPGRSAWAAPASCPARRTWRSSTASSTRARSPTSSCPGSRPASSGGRRWSGRRRWSSTTTAATSRCASTTRASCRANPESFGEYLKYRTGDIVSPHIERSEPIALQMEDFCRAIRSGSTPALVGAARARRRAHDRGGGAVAQSGTRGARADDAAVLIAQGVDGARRRRSRPARAGAHEHVSDDGRAAVRLLRRDQVDDLRALGVDVDGAGVRRARRASAGTWRRRATAAPGAAARPLRHRARPLRPVRRRRRLAARARRW